MPRIPRKTQPSVTAAEIYKSADNLVISAAVQAVLSQGGAIMLGQTRDNAKLIVTVYLDGEQDKEYCDDVEQFIGFIGQYQV